MTLTVDDIRPREVMSGQQAAVAVDVEWLAQRRSVFEAVPCPACSADRPVPLYEKNAVRHVRCASCGTQYASPRPPEAVLNEFYERSENYKYWAEHIYPRSSEARRKRLFQPRATFAAEIARRSGIRNGRLLEVGAGYGWFCEEAAATGAFGRIVGMEPTPHLANVCRRRGIEVVESPYEAYWPHEGFDFVASFEVIEHLHDPGKFVSWCTRILNPGGILLLTCPNIAGFETTCLGAASGTIDHQHINLFSPNSIKGLLHRHGFDSIEVDTPGELDVEIVREALQTATVKPDQVGAFVAKLLLEGNTEARDSFQSFLKSSGNSSHMRIVARRATGG